MKYRNNSPRLKKLFVVSILLMMFTFTLSSCSCAKVDPELVIALFCSEAQSTISVEECKALGAIYNSTNGSRWTDRTGWFDDENPCNWFGVTCENEQVIELDLESNNLQGKLPDGISGLTYLKKLRLMSNSLEGYLPLQALGELEHLTVIFMPGNHFTGSLCGISELENLEFLHLGNNGLFGTIPPEIGSMDKLEVIHLFNNILFGPLPKELGNLTSLNYFLASGNELSGEIPEELGNMDSLMVFDVSSNMLSGPIPPSLGNLPRLSSLDLSFNDLSGKIPSALSGLVRLRSLNLAGNQLKGRIPSDLGNLLNLEQLNLNRNQLEGTIPPSFENLTEIAGFFIAKDNDLCQPDIPSFQQWFDGVNPDDPEYAVPVCGFDCGLQNAIPTTECDALQILYNSTSGPAWTTNTGWPDHSAPCTWHGVGCQGGHVTTLDLHGNNLVGTLPGELSDLTSIERLRLGGNNLSGPLPLSLKNLSSLIHLEYDDTNICEPDALEFLDWLFRPGLSREGTDITCDFSCELQEDLPISECVGLQYLYQTTNGSSWTDHTHWMENRNPCVWKGVECTNGHVTKIALRDNNLTGSLTSEIGNLLYLNRLDLGNNHLGGSLPAELAYLSRLEDLWLFDNDLRYSLPTSIGGMCGLRSIYVQNNQLSGNINPEIGYLSNLRYIDFGFNGFNGEIPVELGRLPVLQELILTSNNLSGEIPNEITNLHNLDRLLLGNNNLEGKLPNEIGTMTKLIHLQVYANQLSGRVPEEIGNLHDLKWLLLSQNEFFGAIPVNLTSLNQLVEFEYYDTNLCTSPDSSIQSWLNSIGAVIDNGVTCNTLAGTDIVVRPEDENISSSTPVEITFNNVKLDGSTTLATTGLDIPPSFGFKIGNPPSYYLIKSTASFSQGYTICINFTGVEYDVVDDLAIQQYTQTGGSSQGNWKILESDIDIGSSEVCAEGKLLFTFE